MLRLLNDCQESLETGRTVLPGRRRSMAAGAEPSWFPHPSAVVAETAMIGRGTKIWHFSHVMKGARIGEDCSFGQNCHIAGDVIIGNNVKVQNNVSDLHRGGDRGRCLSGPVLRVDNVSNRGRR